MDSSNKGVVLIGEHIYTPAAVSSVTLCYCHMVPSVRHKPAASPRRNSGRPDQTVSTLPIYDSTLG